MKPEEFLRQLEDPAIQASIAQAERQTSGEIRVFVTRRAVRAALPAAQRQFDFLGMRNTAQRNGVLLYFAPRTQRFAVVGDEGIHKRCGDRFWESVRAEIEGHLKAGRFSEAVVIGVGVVAAELARHFPRQPDDRNELPDAVVTD